MKLMTRGLPRALVGAACLMLAHSALAVTYRLTAKETDLTLPDGRVVKMWGFANAAGDATIPGPVLTIPTNHTQLRIFVTNRLSVPISIVIPGLTGGLVYSNGVRIFNPGRFVDDQGRVRARSFVPETPPNNTVTFEYRWNNVLPGTYLYHSGSHPALQVQMGLYGAVQKPFAWNAAYDNGLTHDYESLFLFSEIDPDVHEAVSSGNYGPGKTMSSTIHSEPRYFLINGKAFSMPPPGDRLPMTFAGEIGKTTLLRLLNAGNNPRAPILHNHDISALAEDGKPYPYVREFYAAHLPALKTMDVLVKPEADGLFAFYDRCLGLVNAGQSPGGMMTHLGIAKRFEKTEAVAIPGTGTSGAAGVYPSSLTVSGLEGVIRKVTITLTGLSHDRPADLDLLLVSPSGAAARFLSDRLGSNPINNVTITLDDEADRLVPATLPVWDGPFTYRPYNTGNDPFPAPAPSGALPSALSTFNLADPNGEWKLYVVDDAASFTGSLAGWSLNIVSSP